MVIPEVDDLSPDAVDRLIFCSGKVYYDLLEARRTGNVRNVAIVRLEQLYPFPRAAYAQALSEYPHALDVVWCQEEPQNQGAWYQIRHKLQEPLTKQALSYAGRASAAAPAAGIFQVHMQEQQTLVAQALDA
jgi:2-oxoglutarate dehydrogenase E1 component